MLDDQIRLLCGWAYNVKLERKDPVLSAKKGTFDGARIVWIPPYPRLNYIIHDSFNVQSSFPSGSVYATRHLKGNTPSRIKTAAQCEAAYCAAVISLKLWMLNIFNLHCPTTVPDFFLLTHLTRIRAQVMLVREMHLRFPSKDLQR